MQKTTENDTKKNINDSRGQNFLKLSFFASFTEHAKL